MSSPLTHLWTHAQSAITALCASLMPLDTLSAGERRQLRGWLRALEAFCRRLALTEALVLARELWRAATRSAPQAARAPRTQQRPALRLWPRSKPARARIRLLGAPTSVREIEAAQHRAALAARLAAGRGRRTPPHLRLADRIEALQRFLDAPRRALRRLALKLRQAPALAARIAARRAPSAPFLSREHADECETLCYAAVCDSS